MDKRAYRRRESVLTEIFFILGSLVILVGLIYTIKKSWPTFDPLALAMLIGIGFLLVVVCERLRVLVVRVGEISENLERLAAFLEHRSDPADARRAR